MDKVPLEKNRCVHKCITYSITEKMDYFCLEGLLQLHQLTVIATLNLGKCYSIDIAVFDFTMDNPNQSYHKSKCWGNVYNHKADTFSIV